MVPERALGRRFQGPHGARRTVRGFPTTTISGVPSISDSGEQGLSSPSVCSHIDWWLSEILPLFARWLLRLAGEETCPSRHHQSEGVRQWSDGSVVSHLHAVFSDFDFQRQQVLARQVRRPQPESALLVGNIGESQRHQDGRLRKRREISTYHLVRTEK